MTSAGTVAAVSVVRPENRKRSPDWLLSNETAFENAAIAVIWPEVCPLSLSTMVDVLAALLTDFPMSDIPCSARLTTLSLVLTLVAVSLKASMLLTWARRLSAKPRLAPCPA